MTEELRERFKKFDRENPSIFREFSKLSNQMRASGRTRYSAWAVINVIRWHRNIQTTGEDFKVCNDFISLYSRKLAKEDKTWKEFFGLKALKGEEE